MIKFYSLLVFGIFSFNLGYSYQSELFIHQNGKMIQIKINYINTKKEKIKNLAFILPKNVILKNQTVEKHYTFEKEENRYVLKTHKLILPKIKEKEVILSIEYEFPVSNKNGSAKKFLPTTLTEDKATYFFDILHQKNIIPYLVFPFIELENTYMVKEVDQPVLIYGSLYSNFGISKLGTNFEYYTTVENDISLKDISAILDQYERVLGKNPYHTIVFNVSTSLKNYRFSKNDTYFINLPLYGKQCLKQEIIDIWTNEKWTLDQKEAIAIKDLLQRALLTDGKINTKSEYFLAVPKIEYFKKALQVGFSHQHELYVNVPNLIQNFALLHFASTIIGIEETLSRVKNLNHFNEWIDSFKDMYDPKLIDFYKNSLFPFTVINKIPLLEVEKNILSRSSLDIPDIDILVNDEMDILDWKGQLHLAFKTDKKNIILDPKRKIARINFFKDRSHLLDDKTLKTAYDTVLNHQFHYSEEVREVLYFKKITDTTDIFFNYKLKNGKNLYVAVLETQGILHNRPSTLLKTLLINVDNSNKGEVLDYQIRY